MGEYLSLQVLLHAEFQRPTPIAKDRDENLLGLLNVYAPTLTRRV